MLNPDFFKKEDGGGPNNIYCENCPGVYYYIDVSDSGIKPKKYVVNEVCENGEFSKCILEDIKTFPVCEGFKYQKI